MKYRTIVTSQKSIQKLLETNRIPWETALELADFGREIDRVSADYNKAHNVIQFEYGKIAEKEDEDVMPIAQQESREIDIQELLDKECECTVPSIDEAVFKKLYAIKKEPVEEGEEPETIFTIEDLKAYKAIGLF